MPLRGEGHSDLVGDEAPYFRSLTELDAWFAQPHDKLHGVLPYQPHFFDGQGDNREKLLVGRKFQPKSCDFSSSVYKGGYTESCSGLCYTFNFWRLCDAFVYFSHNRVTVPPSGWANAGHKQGTRVLGTLIFEGRNNPDCLQLIVGYANCIITDGQIPISRRYAVLLAELAYQRGFDGYLLNFESHLSYGTDHARSLAAWILLLKAELRDKVGPHAQVIWYDSVIYNGLVLHQNRLNGLNLPFFLASDTFFTNYWWSPETQISMTRYFMDLKHLVPSLHTLTDVTSVTTKTTQDIYSGVDVWPGRGQYGGSGFHCYRAITYTSPLGFSTALFAPGWTWESATKDPEKNWSEWWDNERRLWLGPLRPGEIIPIPDSREGPFKPMTAFFQDLPPPDPSRFAFYTHFSPGVGFSWFVEGKKVLDTKKGWTDIDKQGSIGNLAWPWPNPSWQDVEQEEAAPTASTALDMTDAYNGGNTLKLTLTCEASKPEDTVKVVWLPVQSLTVTTGESFEARVIYKTAASDVDLNPHIYVKSLQKEESDKVFNTGETAVFDLPQGWTSQSINFTSTSTRSTMSVAIGFLVDIKPKDPLTKVTFSLSLGQLAVYPTLPPQAVSVGTPSIARVKFAPSPHATNPDAPLEGVLTWDTVSTFGPIDEPGENADSTIPAWLLQDTPAYRFPAFVYFNIYVASLDDSTGTDPTAGAVFIGTTGLDGRVNRFYVEPACLPFGCDQRAEVRFYVQGVTDRGEVLPWERCAFVDHGKSAARTQEEI